MIARRWRAGDTVRLTLPMRLTAEATPDDPSIVAFVNGPLVLAADLAPQSAPFDGLGPALLSDGPATAALTRNGTPHGFTAR
ncbi:hypothetical protein, partial [Clostridium perfringens]